ncbi:MAG TPA: DedA family protein [Steroidobacteraceae bacterium]|jgi:membrane-associated protein|nr:DedA family protein [Steroidobacteraceae bacterium]
MLSWLIDLVLHLDRHLVELLVHVDLWIYPILFAVIFAETGLVVTPFLPGDSLLFGVGALAAIDTSGTLDAPLLFVILGLAAVLGNTANYSVGRLIGPPAFSGRYRLLKVQYLRRTEEFFRRHGGRAIALSRFVPIIRTCMPFVAGVGRMPYARFQAYNILGGFAWVLLFLWGGYLFGNVPIVKRNFGLVTILIIAVSLIPVAFGLLRRRRVGPDTAA